MPTKANPLDGEYFKAQIMTNGAIADTNSLRISLDGLNLFVNCGIAGVHILKTEGGISTSSGQYY